MTPCNSCKFLVRANDSPECHRHAPVGLGQATGGAAPSVAAAWPKIPAGCSGCGEGETAE
jgi:hypothetical protein